MKRMIALVAMIVFVPPADAQMFGASMTPTPPAVTLGNGLPAALANPANSSGGVPLLGGFAAQGDCLAWSANGIQDAGSPCFTSSTIGTTSISGAGAPVATSLANRATDFGVTFNLKTDFGAACDGSTDDTTAITNWLAKATANVTLTAPAGICNFSSTVHAPSTSHYGVIGAGPGSTVFNYTGPTTLTSLIDLQSTAPASILARDFSVKSVNAVTGPLFLSAVPPSRRQGRRTERSLTRSISAPIRPELPTARPPSIPPSPRGRTQTLRELTTPRVASIFRPATTW